MFLKSAPPAVAIHSDWRSIASVSSIRGGAPRCVGLPLCFNDSDSSLPSTGSPIRHKVQMIIDTLRSTQSSSDGDQMEVSGSAHTSRELLRQPGRKSKPGTSSSRAGRVTDSRASLLQPLKEPESQESDTDSDSSVDRGIEEAIQEYLKEKGDRKRRPEHSPITSTPAPKQPRRETPTSTEQPDAHSCSDGNNVLTASNHIPKNLKEGVNPVTSLKNRLKRKRPSKDNPVKKTAMTMLSFFMKRPSLDHKEASSLTALCQDEAQPPSHVKANLDTLDDSSSSDDGIEEEIQRYQQQKKNQEQLQLARPPAPKDESDSSSDDGIEEAILRFQQEKKQREKLHLKKKKKKNAAKLPQPKNITPPAKPGHHMDKTESPAGKKPTKPANSNKLKRKRACKVEGKTSMPGFSPHRATSASSLSCDSFSSRGCDAFPSKPEPPPVPMLKVNTTAELMCAEAILDISKAVMPMTFDPRPTPLEASVTGPAVVLPQPSSMDPSDAESSVDSEEGIELEIRKFLEQKAQMQKETPAALVKAEESPPATLRQNPLTESDRGAHTDDKSSSLASDEDLDAAIKDLLKTKKKVKKKVKKPLPKPTTATAPAPPRPKKHKPPSDVTVRTAKHPLPKRLKKKTSQVKSKPHKSVKVAQDTKQEKKGKAQGQHAVPQCPQPLTEGVDVPDGQAVKEEDSSSVDSDDSIEQEIRKFLAEKAKVGGGQRSEATDGTLGTCAVRVKPENKDMEIGHQEQSKAFSPNLGVKLEDQQAEMTPDLTKLCSNSPQGTPLKPDSAAKEGLTTPRLFGQGGHSHYPATPARNERRKSLEGRLRPDAISPTVERLHSQSACETPNSRHQQTRIFDHAPNRTHAHTHSTSRTLGSTHSTPRTQSQSPSSPNEIPSSQMSPYPARTSDLSATCTPVLGQSRHSTVVDSCGWTTVRSASLPVVAFYHSSVETPVSRDSQAARESPCSRLQTGGKRGRWDQPPPLAPQSSCPGPSQRSLWPQPAAPSQWGNHAAAGGRQDRGRKWEKEREGHSEVRQVMKQEEECVDETDLDSEEEKEERRNGDRQKESRQPRFPDV